MKGRDVKGILRKRPFEFLVSPVPPCNNNCNCERSQGEVSYKIYCSRRVSAAHQTAPFMKNAQPVADSQIILEKERDIKKL